MAAVDSKSARKYNRKRQNCVSQSPDFVETTKQKIKMPSGRRRKKYGK